MTTPMISVLSCGAGVQSTALALLMRDRELPPVDHVIFADTGWEPARVYVQVDRLAALFEEMGIPFHRVAQGHLRNDTLDPGSRFASIPYFVRNPDGTQGLGRRQCTHEYKLKPITRKIRELLGAAPPRYLRVPKGRVAEQWVGFSTDEIGRVRPSQVRQQYLATRFPLLDLGMSRQDCAAYLDAAGWGDTAKSSCIGCPFHGNAAWRDLRDNYPAEWADAVAFDHAIRHGGSRARPLAGRAYLHRSCLPLELAPIDRRTRAETAAETAAELAEQGDPDGCSPYGCRSGEQVG